MLKKVRNYLVALPALLLGFANFALAEVPAAVQTEIDGAKTDVSTIGAAVFAVIVAIMLFKWFRRAL